MTFKLFLRKLYMFQNHNISTNIPTKIYILAEISRLDREKTIDVTIKNSKGVGTNFTKYDSKDDLSFSLEWVIRFWKQISPPDTIFDGCVYMDVKNDYEAMKLVNVFEKANIPTKHYVVKSNR